MDKKPKILVIDDDEGILKVLKKRLTQAGYLVECVLDGMAGIQKVRADVPDLILLDVLMPGMNGMQVKEMLNKEESTGRIPVFFLTVKDETRDKVSGMKLGAEDYVTKPFDFDELLARVGAAIERKKRLENASDTDSLTGLGNVRCYQQASRRLWGLAKRYKRAFSMAILDVDDLKKINDEHGHAAGDEVLKTIARVMRRVFREADILARYGGDEFVVLLPETSEAQAQAVFDRFKKEIASEISSGGDGGGVSFTISVGVAGYEECLKDERTLFQLADQRMYEQKRAGKAGRKKRILLVEDDEGIRKTVSFRLRQAGYDVEMAKDGEMGLRMAAEIRPDLVILDLMLPKLSGEEVCKNIRADENETFSNTPVIMLTAKSSTVDRIVGRVIGADVYMTKPFEVRELLDNIFRCIQENIAQKK